jgi:hypothetical protein
MPVSGKNISPNKVKDATDHSFFGNASLFDKDKVQTIGEVTNDSDEDDEPGFLSGRGLNY